MATKILTAELFRTLTAWMVNKIQSLWQSETNKALAAMTFVFVGNEDNGEEIYNAFLREPQEGETEHMRIVFQAWNDSETPDTRHEVYDYITYLSGYTTEEQA